MDSTQHKPQPALGASGIPAVYNSSRDVMQLNDFVVHNAQQLVAAIELKNREALTPDLAATLRRNLIAHGGAADAPFFLLLSQDKGYLWIRPDPAPAVTEPDLEFSMKPVVKRFFPGFARQRLRESELAMIASQWLWSLTDPDLPLNQEPERSLAKVGFVAALQGGTVARTAAA